MEVRISRLNCSSTSFFLNDKKNWLLTFKGSVEDDTRRNRWEKQGSNFLSAQCDDCL
jgi:hypothetical protein